MTAMKFSTRVFVFAFAVFSSLASRAAPQNGSIEFVARATPSGGLEEPVRGFPFYLLSRSFEQISREVESTQPEADMDAFIDKLDASKELKTWMKKNHWVQLSGEDFLHKLTPSDIVAVPEFYSAYLERSAGAESFDFPKAKFKSVDKTKDPAKYQKLSDDYHQAVQHYIEQNPASKDGMDLDLVDKNPGKKWQALTAKRQPEIHRQTIGLAQSKYLVARAETNLQGQGFLNSVPAGTYWLSSLDVSAEVGDTRPRWDVPVTVRPGETAYVVLSNVNALQPPHTSPD
jgi:hypothetical protein